MSLLSGFLQGAADQFIVENNKRAAQEKEYMDRKRAIAERQRLAAEDRKARRAERLEERKWAQEDRAEADSRKVVETYVNDKGEVVERLADGTTRIARSQTQQERGDADLNRRYKEAQIAAYNRGGSGGGDDEQAYKVTDDEALGLLGLMSEEELMLDPAAQDAYTQLKGRRLTETQKDEIRRRFRARIQAARNRNSQAQRGAIMFDEGTGINVEDQTAGLLDRMRRGED